jgi:adenylate cyclase
MEIERKFLVKGEYKSQAVRSFRIMQGYLSSATGRTVRIRIKGDKGFITIKGKSNESGLSRYEWEKEIPVNEAEELLLLCEPGAIDKTRYEIPVGKHTFEVDEFYGDNSGLTLAEVELRTENESYTKPEWLGEEVTGNRRYYNSNLTKNPFKNW